MNDFPLFAAQAAVSQIMPRLGSISANGTSIAEEATKYFYGSPVNASWQTAVVYPDSTDTVAQNGNGDWTITAGSDHTSTAYNWLGQQTSTTDQRGVVHGYVYDSAGRVSYDTVTSFGSGGVDSAVQSIGTTYDDMGRMKEVTSYSGVIQNAGGGIHRRPLEGGQSGRGCLRRLGESEAAVAGHRRPGHFHSPNAECTIRL